MNCIYHIHYIHVIHIIYIYICVFFFSTCCNIPELELYSIPNPSLSHLSKVIFLSLFDLRLPESRARQKLYGSPAPLPPPHLLASAQCKLCSELGSWLLFPHSIREHLKPYSVPVLPGAYGQGAPSGWHKGILCKASWPEGWPHMDGQ